MIIGDRVNSSTNRILIGVDEDYPLANNHFLVCPAKSKLLYQIKKTRFSEYEYRRTNGVYTYWVNFFSFSSGDRWYNY